MCCIFKRSPYPCNCCSTCLLVWTVIYRVGLLSFTINSKYLGIKTSPKPFDGNEKSVFRDRIFKKRCYKTDNLIKTEVYQWKVALPEHPLRVFSSVQFSQMSAYLFCTVCSTQCPSTHISYLLQSHRPFISPAIHSSKDENKKKYLLYF